MYRFHSLEQRLKTCRASKRQEDLMRIVLGLGGELLPSLSESIRRAWPELTSEKDWYSMILLAVSERRSALKRIKSALKLSAPEFLMLKHIQGTDFWKDLISQFPNNTYAEIEKTAMRFKKPGSSGLVGGSILSLTIAQARIADILLGLDGETVEGGMFNVTRKLFPKLATGKEVKRAWFNIKYLPKAIYSKIEKVWRLPDDEYREIISLDPWYLKLSRAYPERTPEALSAIQKLGIRVQSPEKISDETRAKRAEWLRMVQVERHAGKRAREKKTFLEIRNTPLWQELTPHKQNVVSVYYGLDLPGDETRDREAAAQMFGINKNTISVCVSYVKMRLKNINPALLFDVTPREAASETRGTISERYSYQRSQDKKTFLKLAQTPRWFSINRLNQQIVSAYYGFDLPDDKTRGIGQTAQLMNISYTRVSSRITYIKRRLKALDPELPFNVSKYVRSPGRKRQKEETFRARDRTDFAYYLRQAEQFPPMGDDEIAAAASAMLSGDERKKLELFYTCLRHIFTIAFAWCVTRMARQASFAVMDLVQEGNIGFWSSLPEFKGSNYPQLRNFAMEAAKTEIRLALRRAGESVQINPEFTRLSKRISRAWNSFWKEKQRNPEPEELAQILELPIGEIDSALGLMQISVKPAVSLDQPLRADDEAGESSYYQIIPDASAANPEEVLEQKAFKLRERWLAEAAEKALRSKLSPMEQYVLSLRFGFGDEEPHARLTIADMLEMSENEVNIIEEEALKKIRSNQEVIDKIRRFAERPLVSPAPLRLQAMAEGRKEDDAESEKTPDDNTPFTVHRHKWTTMNLDHDLSEEELENPQLNWFIKQGLVPARAWYRPKSRDI